MTTKKVSPIFQLGDWVKTRYWNWRARIVELRGPLGPGGSYIYRIRIPDKPKARYIEVREDQLVALPTTPKAEPSSSTKPRTQGKMKMSEPNGASESVE